MSHLRFSILAFSTKSDLSGILKLAKINFCPLAILNETFSVIFKHCATYLCEDWHKDKVVEFAKKSKITGQNHEKSFKKIHATMVTSDNRSRPREHIFPLSSFVLIMDLTLQIKSMKMMWGKIPKTPLVIESSMHAFQFFIVESQGVEITL